MKRIVQRLLTKAMRWMGHLPMGMLYALSSAARPVMQHVVRYRREVVQENLRRSFPTKDSLWLEEKESRFYAFLCDYAVELLRLSVMGEEEMRRRMRFEGAEEVSKEVRERGIGIIFLGHYGNWEWISSMPLWIDNEIHCGQLFKHIHSEMLDRFFFSARARFGAENIDKNDTLRRIVQLRSEGKDALIGFISDQCPRGNIHAWLRFLHQDTPVFTGAERIARKTGAAVFFAHVSRPRRGEYVCTLRPLATQEEMAQMEELDLTKRYMERLEEMIKECPELWLWSHKRWKIRNE